MKAYKLTLLVTDDDRMGGDAIKTTIEAQKYPNWCIAPEVMSIEEADIGEWDDDHPLNHADTKGAEFDRLFPSGAVTASVLREALDDQKPPAHSQDITANEYQDLAGRTDNEERPPEYYLLCLCEEAGEVAGAYKKHAWHGHNLDLDKIKKELGDVAWYLARAAYRFGFPLSEIFGANIDKLKKRYPDGFTSEASINRDRDDG